MLDINEELKNYKFTEFGNVLEEEEKNYEVLENILNIFTKDYKKIGKEQYKAANGIEEILDILEEKQDVFKELKEREKDRNNEISTILSLIMNILDIFDYINTFALQGRDKNLQDQFELVKEQLTEKLSQSSITILDRENTKFDVKLHNPVAVKCCREKPEGVILQIVRKGYMYKGKILRKADIVVNKYSIS
ncbi:nucleotide exchange factor GrpE [Clostridium sp. JNZ X4-2]